MLTLPEKITLCEVGPRDGLQNEKMILSTEDKVRLVNAATAAGFPVIEVGSFMSPKAVPQMADTDEVFRQITWKEGVEYRALIANMKGVERAAACGCKKVKLNVSASVSHNLANLNCTPAESVARFADCVRASSDAGMETSGSISMAFGSPWDEEIPLDDVRSIIDAYLAAGVTEISLSDASGQAYPAQVAEMCGLMKKEYPQVTFWLHFHNTRGLGMANILAGMTAGFTRFDSSFGGVGGCPFVPGATGNVASEDLVNMCLWNGTQTGVDLEKCMETARLLKEILGHETDSSLLRAGTVRELHERMKKKD